MSAAPIAATPQGNSRDIAFAGAILLILAVFFLPAPPILVDIGLVVSISLSVLILMVALWIERPLEFSAFPTILLVATMLRLALNIATTRLILSHGAEGVTAAGHIIAGFSQLVMGGDFIIGLIVFLILVTVNFLVITKGATRIAEVGARFTLDAIPGKQMAIDADLSSGLIDEEEARRRRRELEEESAFFGAMDGASKFVRGDAIASIVILAINVFGGIVLGVTRYGMSFSSAADVFTKLSVGDGLVSQVPALIVSLGAGLIVAKGGVRGSAERTVLAQLSGHPRAMAVSAALLFALGLMPGLPFFPFALLGGAMALVGRAAAARDVERALAAPVPPPKGDEEAARDSVRDDLRAPEIELCFGKQIAVEFLASQDELSHRLARMRRKFARQYGLVVPPVRLGDDLRMDGKTYEIRIHGAAVARCALRPGESLVVVGDGRRPDYPAEETREPAFGVKALWISSAFAAGLRRDGYQPIDHMSLVLTHLSEVIRGNLAHLLAYRDLRALIDRLEPEYRRLVDDICPAHLSMSGLQAVLKLLLAERVSIRNLHLILEAVAEIAPHARRPEQIAEHVRIRMAQQICGDLMDSGVLKVLRLGAKWDLAFHQALKRDAKGDVVEIDLDPRMVEQFSQEAAPVIRARMDEGHVFVVLAAAEARPFVRMIVERMFPNLQTLSHLEIARGVEVAPLGAIA
ncbi:MAG: flagellar biosynthesis protein FlhA [Methylobacteriaceae bacterium]|nr:flagellar biosynthesis protein FlhA [Methylobacteriaceae bacterium]